MIPDPLHLAAEGCHGVHQEGLHLSHQSAPAHAVFDQDAPMLQCTRHANNYVGFFISVVCVNIWKMVHHLAVPKMIVHQLRCRRKNNVRQAAKMAAPAQSYMLRRVVTIGMTQTPRLEDEVVEDEQRYYCKEIWMRRLARMLVC